MKILIPTAKELTKPNNSFSKQQLSKISQDILDAVSQLNAEELAKLYKISDKASEIEYQRWQAIKNHTADETPALELFNGLMYRHIKKNLTKNEQGFVAKHVFIASAFYGIIPAYQPIAPHRLDFMVKLKIKEKSLKQLHRKNYDASVSDSQPILSLLSNEFESVFSPEIQKTFIRVSFFEEKNKLLKKHSTISKKARGQFLTHIIEKQITTPNLLETITFNGFTYDKKQSNPQHLVYIKKE